MTGTQACLLGRFRFRVADESLPGIDARRVQELFCYLLLYRNRTHSRDVLADLLCDGMNTAQSRKGLRQALWQLQSALAETDAPGCNDLLLVDNEWVGINPRAGLWVDIEILEEAYAITRTKPGAGLTAEEAATLTGATGLYDGDLLEGWYRDWCIFERERCQSMYLHILDALTDYHEAGQQYEAAIHCASETLRYDRARERAHRRLMQLHYAAGDRTAALRQFETCAAALHEELAVEPSRLTTELYARICADAFGRVQPPQPVRAEPASTPAPHLPTAPLAELRSMQATLSTLQLQLDIYIRAIEGESIGWKAD